MIAMQPGCFVRRAMPCCILGTVLCFGMDRKLEKELSTAHCQRPILSKLADDQVEDVCLVQQDGKLLTCACYLCNDLQHNQLNFLFEKEGIVKRIII
jgi:hypothetical protein